MRKLLLLICLLVLAPIPAQATPTISTGVLLINFANDPSEPFTPAYASSVMFSNPDSVSAFWADSSYGQAILSGDVIGWLTIDDSNTDCDFGTWNNKARALAGIEQRTYAETIYVFNNATCPVLGLGGDHEVELFGGFRRDELIHETGHSLGLLFHPGAVDEVGGPLKGPDIFSLFSGAPYSATGSERAWLGWLTPTMVTSSGSYTLPRLEDQGLLRIPRVDGTALEIDYRQSLSGVTVRYVDHTPGWSDANPPVKLVRAGCDAILSPGETLYDAGSRILITAGSVGTVAQVAITLDAGAPNNPDVTPPSIPTGLQAKKQKNVDLWWNYSTDDRDCSPSYRIYRNGNLIGTSPTPSFTDSPPKRQTVVYTVAAVDASGNVSNQSAPLTVKT